MLKVSHLIAVTAILGTLIVANGCAANPATAYDEGDQTAADGGQCKAEATASTCTKCCTAIDPVMAGKFTNNMKQCEGVQGFDFGKILGSLIDAGVDALAGAVKGAVGGGGSKPSTPSGTGTPAGTPEPTKPADTFRGFYGGGRASTEQPGETNQFAGSTCVADVKADCRNNPTCAKILSCLDEAECASK
jgi:hypothetical protein